MDGAILCVSARTAETDTFEHKTVLMKSRRVAENFSALTRLDHNRAVGQLALKAGADVEDVTGCIIWGNHSSTQYPDINSATIKGELLRRVLAAVVVVWECSWN